VAVIEIDGFWWFVFALIICGWHASFILSWRRERRLSDAWWSAYDVKSRLRHEALMQAFARENDDDDDDGEGDDDDDDDDEEVVQQQQGEVDVAALELDPATQKIVDAFDERAKKRAAELLSRVPDNEPLQRIRDGAFCLGYKAGVIDLGAAQRQENAIDIAQIAAVFAAACAWRDSPRIPDALAGAALAVTSHEDRLIAAVDAARAAKKEGSP
jgi:hypothetical protein